MDACSKQAVLDEDPLRVAHGSSSHFRECAGVGLMGAGWSGGWRLVWWVLAGL